MLVMMPKMGIMIIGLARAVTGEDDQISYCDHISSTRLAPFNASMGCLL